MMSMGPPQTGQHHVGSSGSESGHGDPTVDWTASSWRQVGKRVARRRLARKPKKRMRTKPLGRTCKEHRRTPPLHSYVSPRRSSCPEQIDLSHAKGEESALVADAIAKRGNVLFSWEHEAIPATAGQIKGNSTIYPRKWPSERFDLVWLFGRGLGTTNWTFTQFPQMLLPGDVSDPIP
jgi:hypothetical protein